MQFDDLAPISAPHRHQARATAHPARPHLCMVSVATRAPSRSPTASSQNKNATVMLVSDPIMLPISLEVAVCIIALFVLLRSSKGLYFRQALPVRAIHRTASKNRRPPDPVRPEIGCLAQAMRFQLRPLGIRPTQTNHAKTPFGVQTTFHPMREISNLNRSESGKLRPPSQ